LTPKFAGQERMVITQWVSSWGHLPPSYYRPDRPAYVPLAPGKTRAIEDQGREIHYRHLWVK
jgi:hypothetical protein